VIKRNREDSLGYLSLDGLHRAVQQAKSSSKTFCSACFNSTYPVPVPDLLESPRLTTTTTTTTISPDSNQKLPRGMDILKLGPSVSLVSPSPSPTGTSPLALVDLTKRSKLTLSPTTIAYDFEKKSESEDESDDGGRILKMRTRSSPRNFSNGKKNHKNKQTSESDHKHQSNKKLKINTNG
jgi:hypothetical protein